MRRGWMIAIVLVGACGGRAPDAKPAGGGAKPHSHGGGVVGTITNAGSASANAGSAAAPDIGCLHASCAYHAGAEAYFTCLAGGAGMCFHFGGPCAPADGCMYDQTAKTYKQCAKPVEGTCAQWGAACAPASACMFDPGDGMHHHCDEIAGGACRKYGALCAP